MARPTTIRREDILEAARRLFLSGGYDVSTAAIAKAAGCSEGTIFKRFETKERLFREAMGIPDYDLAGRLDPLVGKGDLEETLTTVCLEIIEYLRVLVPRVMRLWAHDSADPMSFAGRREGPHAALKTLANYFDQEMRLGRLRPGDPEVLARIFVGSLHNYVFMELVGVHLSMPIPAPTFVRGLIDMLFTGVAPLGDRRGAAPAARTGTR